MGYRMTDNMVSAGVAQLRAYEPSKEAPEKAIRRIYDAIRSAEINDDKAMAQAIDHDRWS